MYRCLLTARFKQKLYCLEWTIAVQGFFGRWERGQKWTGWTDARQPGTSFLCGLLCYFHWYLPAPLER